MENWTRWYAKISKLHNRGRNESFHPFIGLLFSSNAQSLLLPLSTGQQLSEDEPRHRLFTTLKPNIADDQKMLIACRDGDLETVKELFKQDPKLICQQDKEGLTALMVSIVEGHSDVADYLTDVSDPASLLLQDTIGNRAFHYAAYCRALWLARKMVEERGCDVIDTLTPKTTNRAIHLAMMSGCVPMVEFLIANGAKLENVVETGPGIIWSAVVQDRLDTFIYCFRLLLQRNLRNLDASHYIYEEGSDLAKMDPKEAALVRERELLHLYNPALETGVDSASLYWHAVSWGATKIINWLVENGYAKWEQMVESTTTLVEYPIGLLPKPTGCGVLTAAALNGCIEIMKEALKNGIQFETAPNAKPPGNYQGIAISFAAHGGFLDTIKFMESLGVPLMSITETGLTPITSACRAGHLHVLKYFYEKLGSQRKVLERPYGVANSCLGSAAGMNQVEIMKWLIDEVHVNIEETDLLGYTAVHVACEYGSLDALNLLVERGASLDAIVTDAKYFPTPFLLATVNSRPTIMERLLELKPDCFYDLTQYRRNAFVSAALGGCVESMKWLSAHEKKEFTAWSELGDGRGLLRPFVLTEEGEAMRKYREREAKKNSKGADKKDSDDSKNAADSDSELNIMIPALPQRLNPHVASHLSELLSDKQYDVIKYLVRSGLDPSKALPDGNSLLLLSVWFGSPELFEWLVDVAKADVLVMSESGVHLIHFAASRGNMAMMRAVVTRVLRVKPDFDWDLTDSSSWTPLMFAISAGKIETLNYLADELKVPITKSKSSVNCMEMASSCKNVKVFDWLLERGVPWPLHNVEGIPSPFLMALRYSDLNAVQYLHRALRFDLQDKPRVCVSWVKEAMSNDDASPAVVAWLLDQGLSPFDLDGKGSSVVHFACLEGYVKVLKMAHNRGMVLGEVRDDGNSGMTLASANNRKKVVHYLLAHGEPPTRYDTGFRSPGEIAVLSNQDALAQFFAGLGFP